MSAFAAAAVIACVVLAAVPATAVGQQEVRGTVRDGESGAPVVGAMVVLLDAEGHARARALSMADGRFVLTVPTPGRYSLRVDLIGYASTSTQPFAVAAGETVTRDVTTTVRPILLEGVETEGARLCQLRPAEGLATARVWEEARKALAAATWTAERELYRFTWTRYERDIAPNGSRILDERRTHSGGYTARPFRAVNADSLMRVGFVQRRGDDVFYYAPDAAVLLSDAFLDTHCLALSRRVEDGVRLLGLRFEPVPGRHLPDVAGVVWLEEEGARLRSLEYRYVNVQRRADGDEAGGEIAFREMPNGTWIVQEWRIRMPSLHANLDQRGDTVGYRVIGFRDEGGEVSAVFTRGGAAVPGGLPGGALEGLVTDSLGRGAAGARVRLVGTVWEVVTRADGTFRFPDVGPGTWSVEASHAALTAFGHPGTAREVEVRRGHVTDVRLELPSLRRIALDRCRATPPGAREAVLIGRVLEPDDAAVAGADVRVQWAVHDIVGGGLVSRSYGAGAVTDAQGTYSVCQVPTDLTVRVTASVGERASDTLAVAVTLDAEVVTADLRLPAAAAPAPAVPAADAALPSVPTPAFADDSLWLAAKGFWLRRQDALLQRTQPEIAVLGVDTLTKILAPIARLQTVLMANGRREVRLHASDAWRERSAQDWCEAAFYLNGSEMLPGGSFRDSNRRVPDLRRAALPLRVATGVNVDDLFDVAKVTGIEVFDPDAAPVGTPQDCGAILLWIRSMTTDEDPDFTGSIGGRITCAPAGIPMPGVRVHVEPSGAEEVTDDAGRFDLGRFPPARYVVTARIPGWGDWTTEVALRAGATADVAIELDGSRCSV